MLYIISFQSISCREASPASPRPHKGPPEGVSARAEGAGLHPVHTPLLRKEFSTVLRAVPRVGSLSGLWAGSDRSSGRAVSSVIPSIFHTVSPHVAQLGPLAGLPLNLPPGFPHVAQLGHLAGLPLNLPPGFPHVAQLCPLAGPSKQFSSRPERRSSPRPPYSQVPQCHSGVAKPSSIIPSPRPPCPQILQRHPHVPNNHIISLKLDLDRSFATVTLPTSPSVPSPRAEQSNNLSQTGL